MAFSRRIGAQTGGLRITTMLQSKPGPGRSVGSREDVIAYLVLRGKAVASAPGSEGAYS